MLSTGKNNFKARFLNNGKITVTWIAGVDGHIGRAADQDGQDGGVGKHIVSDQHTHQGLISISSFQGRFLNACRYLHEPLIGIVRSPGKDGISLGEFFGSRDHFMNDGLHIIHQYELQIP